VVGATHKDPDNQLLPHAGEDSRGHMGRLTLGREVDDPPLVHLPAQVQAHSVKPEAPQVSGVGEEANDAGLVGGVDSKTDQGAERQK